MSELSDPVSVPADARLSRDPAKRLGQRQTSPLARIGMATFGIGLLAVVVIMAAFASGAHDLPLWLNLTAMLAPIGFGLGLIGVFVEARGGRTRQAAGPPAQPGGNR